MLTLTSIVKSSRFISILTCFIFSGTLSYAGGQDTIFWNSNRLQFQDFKMKTAGEQFTKYLESNSRTTLEGYIFSGIQFSCRQEGHDLSCIVKAFMIPEQSWLRNPVDEGTLAHEQAHFDLTEIYARRLRRDLMNIKSTAAAKKLMQTNFRELQDEQKRFDKSHKNETSVEPYWKNKIEMDLKALANWAEPTVNILLPLRNK